MAASVMAETCIDAPGAPPQTDAQRGLSTLYENAMRALESFPSLRDTVSNRSPGLCYAERMDGAHGYLDVERNRIYITQGLPEEMQLGILLHEIRHLDQIALGACPSDHLAMEEYARATFALEADASAISLLVAWQLKEKGQPAVWSALSSWDSQSDIAARFKQEMATVGTTGAAVSAAFDQWYASDHRRAQYYLSICSAYLDRQDASKALPRYLVLSPAFFDELCTLPDGQRYLCSEPEHARP